MKRRIIILFFGLFIIVFSVYSALPLIHSHQSATTVQKQFTEYLDQLFSDWVSSDTVTLHYQLANPSNYHISLETLSLSNSYFIQTSDYEKELDKLHAFQNSKLNTSQKKTYHILEDYLTREKNLSKYPFYQTVFSPTTGLQAQLPVTLCEFPLRCEGDIRIYLSLLKEIPDYFQELYENEQEKSEQGLFYSNRILDQILDQMDSFISETTKNPLITSFPDRIHALSLGNQKEQQYIHKNQNLILYTVLPAYQTLRNNLASLKNTGKNDLGLCYYDHGKEYYAALIASLTGSDATPKEMIKMTEQNLSECYKQLEEILYLHPDAYEAFLNTKIEHYIPNSEKKTLDWLKKKISPDFPSISNVSHSIKTVPQCLEDYVSPAFYMLPSIDLYRNNTIYINRKQLTDLSSAYSVLAHEGYPGHLYQTTYFYEHMEHPILSLCNYQGYVEGWAVYAENLSYAFLDYGKHSSIIAQLYQINHILNLAIPSRIDLGVHYEGWNKKNVKQFLSDLGLEKKEIRTDIFDSIVAEPGNYLSYYIGFLEILALKNDYMKTAQNIDKNHSFHQYFLANGPCDFSYLTSVLH